jgi:hypothetical protein
MHDVLDDHGRTRYLDECENALVDLWDVLGENLGIEYNLDCDRHGVHRNPQRLVQETIKTLSVGARAALESSATLMPEVARLLVRLDQKVCLEPDVDPNLDEYGRTSGEQAFLQRLGEKADAFVNELGECGITVLDYLRGR